ncbi:hypothetical protein PYW08_003374 [Mythimna loreyi]|uniref:Uncharacterized protein n=1 Tax=Mythimna loreyi TaxID=667449 RepID=A0ACC2QS27_9NEOP|nr:hypothetical protein PYW08_003374 [Mythimna loreyi]
MQSCQKHFPEKPIIVKKKAPCQCQGLCLMKKFCIAHKEKCKTIDTSKTKHKKEELITGAHYDGTWLPGCAMDGYGVYTFPNGVVYEGEFKDGSMHGKGELRYETPSGQAIVRGQWRNGIMSERQIFFDNDTLEYDGDDWQYCKIPDRRFSMEYEQGLQPGGISYITASQPSKVVPPDYYDTGDGFYDSKRQSVYDHEDLTRIVRGPSSYERKWIKENCRAGGKKLHIGPRPDLYETFVEPTELLEPNVPPSAKYTGKPQKLISLEFEEDFDLEDVPEFFNSSKICVERIRKDSE